MEYKLQLNEFFIEGGNREKSHVLLHITEPSTEKEKRKGYFFAICELNNGDTKKIVRLQNMVDEIEERYYEAPESINEHSLETVLKRINREHQNTADNLLDLHCVVGVIRNENIIFSFCGKPKMLLFYQARDGQYKKMDLINSEDESNADLFSQIIEGKITPNDFVFIATAQIKDYFDDDRLQKIITARPARQSAMHIEKVLSDIRNEVSFGGLIIHLKEEIHFGSNLNKKPNLLKGGSIKSLNSLFATEKNTASTLSPSIFPKINTAKSTVTETEKTDTAENRLPTEISATHIRQLQPKISTPTKEDLWKKYLLLMIGGLWIGVKFGAKIIYLIIVAIFKTVIEIGHKFTLLFFVITNYQGRRRNILENWTRQWQAFKTYLKTMPKTTKIMLCLIILVIILFIGSVFTIRARQQKLALERRSQEIIRQISIHKEAADSAIIFKDNATAINEARAVKQLIAQLNCKIYKKQCDDFNAEINGILSQIRKETVVEPQLLADFSSNLKRINQLVRINNQLITFSNDSSAIAIYDLLTKQVRVVDSKINGFNDASVPKENDYVAFLYNNKNIAIYNPKDSSFIGAEINYPKSEVKINNILVYNRRLYTLDILNNQIYKHENIKTGYAQGKDWIKDLSADIKNSNSLTTDGDMFISLNNGEIEKLTAGNRQIFTVSGLDPELKSGGKIWTYTDKQFLYIIDQDYKRLVILQKDGTLYGQITATVWKNPTGLVIDEQNKNAFILDNNKLYQINLP